MRLKIHFHAPEGIAPLPAALSDHPGFQPLHDLNGREFGFSLETGGRLWVQLHKVGSFLVEADFREVKAFADPGVDSSRLCEFFYHGVAPLVLQRRAWDCLHASAVLTDRGVIAFCGPSGRGKSTIARAFCERGAALHGDDAVPFLIRNGAVMTVRIPQKLRLQEPAASLFEDGRANGGNHQPHELSWDLETTLQPLRCVYWLEPMRRLGERPAPEVERLSMLDSFRLLLSEAHCISLQDGSCNRKMMRNYLALALSTPVFRLSFGAGLELLPSLVGYLEQNQQTLRA